MTRKREDSFHIREISISGHAGAQTLVAIRQTDFYTENLANSILHRLHIARREFSLPIDLLNRAGEFVVREGIDSHSRLISNSNLSQPRLRYENAHPQMLW